MLKQENLAANFYGLLVSQHNYQYGAIEWRILGQEQNGLMLATWISTLFDDNQSADNENSHIGLYDPHHKSFEILHSFEKRENIIQASVNVSKTLLTFVVKKLNTGSDQGTYYAYLTEIKGGCNNKSPQIDLLPDGSTQQVMTQFLWQKMSAFEKKYEDRLLLFNHEKFVYLMKLRLSRNLLLEKVSSSSCSLDCIDLKNADSWSIDANAVTKETIVKHFIWAQWDPIVQALYYIHLKPAMRSSLEKDDGKETDSTITTLSAHQFHENLPRETVVGNFSQDCFQLRFNFILLKI